jgi:hypothetical protein
MGQQRFQFERFWIKMESFEETIVSSWAVVVEEEDPFRRLVLKLKIMVCQLMTWNDKQIGCIRFQLMMVRELIFRFDVTTKLRLLLELEQKLCARLKHAYLGISSVEHFMAHQWSNIAWLAEGDANMAFVH